jgi:hypothetical protein
LENLNAIIDGDIVIYRCAFAAEKTKYLVETSQGQFLSAENHKEAKNITETSGGVIWSRKVVEPVEHALQAAKTSMEAIVSRFGSYRVYITGERNFRREIAVTQPYKGNRDRNKDPVYKKEVEAYLVERWGAIKTDQIEADDAIGIALSSDEAGCAVTVDKDLDQIPGWHFNWVTGESYRVSNKEADFSLYTQLLTGDPTDAIPGLPGIGQARAAAILADSKSSLELASRSWAAYRDKVEGFEKARAYFIEQLKLVFIQRKASDDPAREALMYLPTGFNFDE